MPGCEFRPILSALAHGKRKAYEKGYKALLQPLFRG